MTALNRRLFLSATAAFAVPLIACQARAASGVLPPPAADETNTAAKEEFVIAGGCFWGVQAVFARVKGVTRAVSGYCGGAKETAQYETVGSGRTGHAESVYVSFDPKVVSFGKLLQIFFTVATDPTELNRQGPDSGTQYRNEIFTMNADQDRVARAYIAQLDKAKVYRDPIVTKVSPMKGFYQAEDYHQDYLILHPNEPYIAINDQPKVRDLKRLFPAVWRDQPLRVFPV
jgi:peptide-methionine (S)-S-oxide reductase